MTPGFERDFAYLMRFLEKIEAAAASAPPEVREELSGLVRGETARWQQVQALLAKRERPKGPVQARPAALSTAQKSPTADLATRHPGAAAEARAAGFTVGPLRRG